MLSDIDKNTVDHQLTLMTPLQPTVLPARIPNLLCNGTPGIVGMATNMALTILLKKMLRLPILTIEKLILLV